MLIDEVINKINQKELFKVLVFVILSFPTFQNYGQMQGILVAIFTPNYTCQYKGPHSNIQFSKDQCLINVNGSLQKCNKWNFSMDPVGKTMIVEYELVCGKKNYGDMILIVWYSSAFTAILMGWLSDKYGRKRIAILNLSIETVASILLSVSPNLESNIILRFLLGISANGIYVTYVWLMESINVEFRAFTGSFFMMFGCLAYMIFPLIIKLTNNWRYTQIVSLVPNVLYLFIYYIPESPRWLFVMGRKREALTSLKTICKINKLNIDFNQINIVVAKEDEKGNIFKALKTSTFLFRTILTFLLQFSTFLFYVGVTVNISLLSNNVLFSMFLLGLMESPGLILAFISLHYFKRKCSILIFGCIGSTLFWFSVFFQREIFWQSVIRIMLGCIAKAIISAVNQITLVYTAESFPTSHRSFSFVFVQLANFLSFVAAIYINKLSVVFFCFPMTIYLVLIWTSSILTYYFLPETKNLPFPETLEDQIHLKTGQEDEYIKYMASKHSRGRNVEETDSDKGYYEDISLL